MHFLSLWVSEYVFWLILENVVWFYRVWYHPSLQVLQILLFAVWLSGEEDCRLNCVLPEVVSPDPQYLWVSVRVTLFGSRIFVDVIEVKWGQTGLGSALICNWCPQKRRGTDLGQKAMWAQRQRLEGCVYKPRTVKDNRWPLKPRKRHGLEHDPAGHLTLDSQPPEKWENTFLWFKPPS